MISFPKDMRPRQHQRLSQRDDLTPATGIDNLQGHNAKGFLVHIHFAGLADEVIQPADEQLQDIAPRVVGHSDQRQPACLELQAHLLRSNLDVRLPAEKAS